MLLAEVYCSISESLYTVYTDKIGKSSLDVAPAHGGIEADEIVVLPDPIVRKTG